MADAMERAQVLDYNLQVQIRPYLEGIKPRPSIYFPDFIAANQADRANNVLTGTKQELLTKIRQDIRDFKETSGVDKVIVLWTANTERYSDVIPEINGTADILLNSIKANESEISPSTIFAVASILEGVSNGTETPCTCIINLNTYLYSKCNCNCKHKISFPLKYLENENEI